MRLIPPGFVRPGDLFLLGKAAKLGEFLTGFS
jgi:hypothetical protein